MSSFVFVKDGVTNREVSLDLTDLLSAGEHLTACSVISISPNETPVLVASGFSVSGAILSGTLSSGKEEVTYGVRVQLTTSTSRIFSITLVCQVMFDLNVAYATKNPVAFQSLLGELGAGEARVGKGLFLLPPGFETAFAVVSWSVVDSAGRVHSEGNAYSLSVSHTSFSTVVEADALVNLPSSTPPTLEGQSYQVRWTLLIPESEPVYAFESLRVPDAQLSPLGAQDTVEFVGDSATLGLTLTRVFDRVGFEVFQANTRVSDLTLAGSPSRVSGGWHYSQSLDTSSLPADLIPYSVIWKYWNVNAPGIINRETSKLFVLSASLMTAVEDCRTQVMKARTTVAGFPDAIFDTSTIISWLRRGRDQFNAAGGMFTHFTMLNATGGIREFWLRYSEVAMLRAQALAEGEKAFDFQGQDISLNVDKAQYYTGLADSLQSTLDNDIRPFKMALKTSGIAGGDGDLDHTQSWNVPRLGMSITPASHLARAPGYRVW